jgi:hypothetical protein
MRLPPETWQRVRALLIEEEYARRLAAGTIDKGKLRLLIGSDVDHQAETIPAWPQQQADRLLGEVSRPGRLAECPGCRITFDPTAPAVPVTLTHDAPLHPRWTNGEKIVAVPPEHADAYTRLGYAPVPGDTGQAYPPTVAHDYPWRGEDGLTYCRPTCAEQHGRLSA